MKDSVFASNSGITAKQKSEHFESKELACYYGKSMTGPEAEGLYVFARHTHPGFELFYYQMAMPCKCRANVPVAPVSANYVLQNKYM